MLFSTDYPFHRPSREEIATLLAGLDGDADRAKFTSPNAATLLAIGQL